MWIEPGEVEEMLRISEDEAEGDDLPPLVGDSNDGAGDGDGDETAKEPQPQPQQQPGTTQQAPPATQEGNKISTLSLSEIKKALTDISNNTGTGESESRRRRQSDPGSVTKNIGEETTGGCGSGFGSRAVSGSGTTTGAKSVSDIENSINDNESDLENDVFSDHLQGSARAPAIEIKLPVEYDMVRAARANWQQVNILGGPLGLNRVWAPAYKGNLCGSFVIPGDLRQGSITFILWQKSATHRRAWTSGPGTVWGAPSSIAWSRTPRERSVCVCRLPTTPFLLSSRLDQRRTVLLPSGWKMESWKSSFLALRTAYWGGGGGQGGSKLAKWECSHGGIPVSSTCCGSGELHLRAH
jgi:hypothetical protein